MRSHNTPAAQLQTLEYFLVIGPHANNVIAATANGIPAPTRPSPAVVGGNPKSSSSFSSKPASAQTVSSKDPKAVAQAANEMTNVVRRKLTGYVGFANLPNQWHRKSVRKGFHFNVMVVGELRPQLRLISQNVRIYMSH